MTYVVQANTATTLWITSSRSSFGEPVTLTATIRSAAPGPVTGEVTFFDGTDTLGTVALDSAGEAHLANASLAAGEHVFRAANRGERHLAPSSAEAHHRVDKVETTAVLTIFVPPETPPPST